MVKQALTKRKVSERDAKGNLVDREVEIKTAKVYHGGAAFVWPIIQGYEVMSMQPIQLNLVLKNALSAQNIRVTIPTTVTVAISQEPLIMQNAANRLLGADDDVKESLISDIVYGQMRLVIASMTIEELNSDRDKFLAQARDNINTELNKLGLYLMNINISDIQDAAQYIDNLGKKEETEAIVQYAMTDRWKEVAEANAKVFEHIQLGNVTVYGDSNTAGQFMANMAKNLAPSLEIARNLPIADSLKQIITGKKPEESPAKGDNFPPVK